MEIIFWIFLYFPYLTIAEENKVIGSKLNKLIEYRYTPMDKPETIEYCFYT